MHYTYDICLGRAAGKTFFKYNLVFLESVPLPLTQLNPNSFPKR